MKKILAIIISLLMLTACSNNSESLNLTEHEQQAVEAVSYYKSILKDPCSLRIFGDIHLLKSNSNGNSFMLVFADAKNSYGGYGGKEPIEITCIYADEIIKENTFIARDSKMEGYNNIADNISEYTKYADGKMPLTYYKVDGEKVAKAIGAEFIEWER